MNARHQPARPSKPDPDITEKVERSCMAPGFASSSRDAGHNNGDVLVLLRSALDPSATIMLSKDNTAGSTSEAVSLSVQLLVTG